MAGRVVDKVAVVMGGGQTAGETIGNGRATAVLLAREGAHVVVADRRLDSAQDTVDMITSEGGQAFACEVDVTVEESIKSLVAQVVARLERIDILHNNVGASIALGDARADEMTVEAFDRSFAVNFKSAWLAAKHAIPVMRQRQSGSIVNISSLAAWEAYPLVGYKTMKAALLALTANLAAANARYGIRVNAILPGLMNTPMAIEARVAQGRASRAEVIAARNQRVPLLHQMGTAWDVAYAALFLHSDEAKFISGAALPVDGAASASFGSYE
jgi:NAD(P)-dependent dehydrogenase (short-subunit alcohol dehydrogenase family)